MLDRKKLGKKEENPIFILNLVCGLVIGMSILNLLLSFFIFIDWQPKMPFISAPLNDLRQLGDVEFGPGQRSPLLGILGGALPKLSSDQYDLVAKAKKYAMEQSIRMVLMKQTLAHHQQLASQRTQVQRQQALALMCR